MSEDKKKKDDAEGGGKPARTEQDADKIAQRAAAKAAGEAKAAAKKKAAEAPKEHKTYKRTEAPRLQRMYKDDVIKKMTADFGYKNPMQVPKLVKITINMGLGEAVANPKLIDTAV